MKRHPVWITGVGAASPLGCNVADIARNLLAGVSGIRKVDAFSVADHPAQIAGVVDAIPCPADFDPQFFDALDRSERAATWSAWSALQDAGLNRRNDLRIGLILGTAAEWNCLWENDYWQGGRRIFESNDQVGLVHRVKETLDLAGPCASLSAACASSNYALHLARRWLELGWVDVCLAGGCDLALSPLTLACFGNLRALSRRNDEPTKASRPFDLERDGFVMGDGCTIFALERAEHVRERGGKAYAEVAGFGAVSDAYHMVIPSPDPGPAIRAMNQALTDARIDPADVDYVNAHATGTSVGDSAEARVLAAVFGSHLEKMPVSSTKSMTGHLLTAAAAFEALACIVAMREGAVPPTINLDHPDPECPLCHVPNQAQQRRVKVAVSNSFGFGGSNTTLVLRAV